MSDSPGPKYQEQELRVPDDPSLTFQVARSEQTDIVKPPGISNLQELGQLKAPAGKHPSKTFAQIYAEDPNYVFR